MLIVRARSVAKCCLNKVVGWKLWPEIDSVPAVFLFNRSEHRSNESLTFYVIVLFEFLADCTNDVMLCTGLHTCTCMVADRVSAASEPIEIQACVLQEAL